jgi:hypothetical protein
VRSSKPPEVIEQARRELRMANAAESIRKIVEESPRLTDDQLNRLAAMLRPGGSHGQP